MLEVKNNQNLDFKKLKVRLNREQINDAFVDMILPSYMLQLIDNYVLGFESHFPFFFFFLLFLRGKKRFELALIPLSQGGWSPAICHSCCSPLLPL